MREILTIVGVMLLAGFVALFSAPLWVDWNGWRSTIEARLTDAIGAPVTVRGPIDARLLPQPWLSLGDVEISQAGGGSTLTIRAAEADVSLGGLLRGATQLSNVVLTGPRLMLATGAEGALMPLIVGDAPEGSIEGLEIIDGAFSFIDAGTGIDFSVEGVSLVGEARSLKGPFQAEGAVRLAGVPVTIRLNTGSMTANGMAVRLSATPSNRPVTLAVEGTLMAGLERPRFEGTVTAAEAAPVVDDVPAETEPWQAQATVSASPGLVTATMLDVALGPDERSVRLAGTAEASFGADPRLDVELAAKQVDLDRLAGLAPGAREVPARVLERLAGRLPAIGMAGLPTALSLDVESLGLGGAALQAVKIHVAGRPDGVRVDAIEAVLPGRATLSFSGALGGGDTPRLTGDLAITARDSGPFLAWLEGVDRVTAANAAREATLKARLGVDPGGVTFDALEFMGAGSALRGRLAVRWLESGGTRLEGDLVADLLDIDRLPGLAAIVPDASVLGEADVALRAERATYAGVEARALSGRVAIGGGKLVVERVAVEDLAGVRLQADGALDLTGPGDGTLSARLDGGALAGLGRLVERLPLPDGVAAAFAARAEALSPVALDVVVNLGENREVTMRGVAGGSSIDARVAIGGTDGARTVDGELSAASLDAIALLRQIGVPVVPLTVPGEARLRLELAGPVASALRWAAAFDGAGLVAEGSGRLTGLGARPAIDGRLRGSIPDLVATAAVFGLPLGGVTLADGLTIESGIALVGETLTFDDLTGVFAVAPFTGNLAFSGGAEPRVSGRLAFPSIEAATLLSPLAGIDLRQTGATGGLPDMPFATSLATRLRGDIALTAAELPIGGGLPSLTDARAVVAFQPGDIRLDRIAATVSGGRLVGALRFGVAGGEAALDGQFDLKGALVDRPDLAGRVDLALKLQGTGRTAAAVAASLTGGGTVTFTDGKVGQVDPPGLAGVISAFDSRPAAQVPTEQEVTAAIVTAFRERTSAIGPVSTPVTLSGGVLRLPLIAFELGGTAATATGSYDLAAGAGQAELVLETRAPDALGGPSPPVGLSFAGGERRIDAAGFTSWLMIRAAEREAATLQRLEDERRQREEEIARQKRAEAERIRALIEADRRAAAERAEAERRAAAEQAREPDGARAPQADDRSLTVPDFPAAPLPPDPPPKPTP